MPTIRPSLGGVRLGADESGVFAFTVPSAASGEELTLELVDWTAPVSLGVVGGPVPSSIPAGGVQPPDSVLASAALLGAIVLLALRRSGGRLRGVREFPVTINRQITSSWMRAAWSMRDPRWIRMTRTAERP